MAFLLGVTTNRAELLKWEPRFVENRLMWIEPNRDGMPPSWSDERFRYCQRHNTIPVIGMRSGGDSSVYPALIRHLSNMPSWLPQIYVTDHAEPEQEFASSPAAFIDNFRDWYLGVVQQLAPIIRAKVKAGPVLSQSWIEDPAKGAGDYSQFDPGVAYSDFYGLNMLLPAHTLAADGPFSSGATHYNFDATAQGWVAEGGSVTIARTTSSPIAGSGGTTSFLGVSSAGGEFGTGGGFSNTSPGAYDSAYHYDGQASFDYLASRGVTHVRIAFRWERVQPTPGGPLDLTELGRLTAVVNRAGAAGLSVILDVHNYAGYYLSGGEVKLGSASLTQAHLVDLWTRLTAAFKNNPYVSHYALMNEPNGLAPSAGVFTPSTTRYDFEATASGWAGEGTATAARTITNPITGSGSLLGSKTMSAGFDTLRLNDAAGLSGSTGGNIAAAGGTLQLKVKVRGANAGTATRVKIMVQDASFTWQLGPSYDVTVGTGGSYGPVTTVEYTPPAGLLANFKGIGVQFEGVDLNGATDVMIDGLQQGAVAGALSAPEVWEAASQAALNAVRAEEGTGAHKTVLVSGYNWSGAQQWTTQHPDPWITDSASNFAYEAHLYFDNDNSGTYGSSFATENANAIGQGYSSLANRATSQLAVFTNWLATYGVKGFIGEVGWPDESGWNAVGAAVYAALQSAGVPSAYWATGEWWGTGYPLAPYVQTGSAGVDTARGQAAVIESYKISTAVAGSLLASKTMGAAYDSIRINDASQLPDDLHVYGTTVRIKIRARGANIGVNTRARIEVQDATFAWQTGPFQDVTVGLGGTYGPITVLEFTPPPGLLSSCKAIGVQFEGTGLNGLVEVQIDDVQQGTVSTVAQLRTSYGDPAAYLNGLRTYRSSSADARPRIIPKFGAIGLPGDLDGLNRAAWIGTFIDTVVGWEAAPAAQGWGFIGAAYWNDNGPAGPDLAGLGTARYYQLDVRQSGYNTRTPIAGDPPEPVWVYNDRAIALSSDPDRDVPGDPVPRAAPAVPPTQMELPPGGLPTDGPAAAKLLRADYTILVTDADLNVIGDPIAEWTTLQCSVRWKEPGSGQITVPAHRYIREQLVPGCRIVVIRRVLGTQHILCAGPLEKVLRERADDGENGGVGVMTISFVDDLAWLGARLAFPNPALPIDAQTTDYWEFAGDPELAMLTLVNTQAGPAALPQRRVPRLRVADYSGLAGAGTVLLGPTSDVAPRERLEKCTDVLRKIATLGANPDGATPHHPDSLGFRIRQTAFGSENYLLFEPVRSRDLSGEVHFSFERGNVEYTAFEQEAPVATHILVGGQGEGADRFVREIPTTDADQLEWGRFESYLARPGTDALAAHEAAAAEDLADKGQSARLAVNASDTVDQRYGVHYNAGDVVSVMIDDGEYEIAPVQTVNVQAWPTAGEVVGTTIGNQSTRYDSPWIRRIREQERRIGRLERR